MRFISPVESDNFPTIPDSTASDPSAIIVEVNPIITEVNSPASAILGETVEMSWTLTNAGSDSVNPYWNHVIYASKDEFFDERDAYITSFGLGDYIPVTANESYTFTKDINITPYVNPGDYYLLFISNGYEKQRTDASNNVIVRPITLTAPDIDLVLNEATAPDSAVLNQTISLSWTVANEGGVTATKDWWDTIYISDDQFLDQDDQFLGNSNFSEDLGLDPQGNYTLTQDVYIPSTKIGDRYLLFVTNDYGEQSEKDRNNNVLAQRITLAAPDVDLVISALTAPESAVLGSPFQVSWTVKNQGTIAANSDWYDEIYLSDDTTLDFESDTFVSSEYISNQITLAADGSYTITQNITLPSTTIGNRYLLVVTDSYDSQGETDGKNNVQAVPIVLSASDLVLPDIIVLNPDLLGTPVETPSTVKQGNVAAENDVTDLTTGVENVNTAPILQNPLLDQTINVNSAFTFKLPQNTFSDLDAVNPFQNLVIFGDSLSDTGNIYQASHNTFPAPPNYQGRAANGLIWPDYFAPNLQFTAQSIKNFAFFGANTGISNTFEQGTVPGLLTQIEQFKTLNTATPIRENGLYVIWVGANDFLGLSTDSPQPINNAVTNIGNAIATLAGLGAKKIVVGNLTDLGALPLSIANNNVANARTLSIGFNNALAQSLNQIDLDPVLNIDIALVDIFGLSTAVQANPANYNFTNITGQLIQVTDPVNPDQYVFWDAVHPTTRLHQLVTNTFEDTLLDEEIIPDLVRYSATLADGSNLPQWLKFNPTTQTFSGTPTTEFVGELDVKLIATDKEGAIATDTFTITIAEAPTVSNISFGSTNSEQLNPTPGQLLFAGNGEDTIESTDDNTIFAGNGNDNVFVNSNSAVFAGDDNDTVVIGQDGSANNTTVNGGNGNDKISVLEANGSNNVFGAADTDELTITEGSNQSLFGGSGDDKLTSQGNNNRLYGGSGNDKLVANSNDYLFGGDGNDQLFVIQGNNSLTGGNGADQFWIANGSLPTDKNTIKDFEIGIDKIGFGGVEILSFGQVVREQIANDTLLKTAQTEIALLIGITANNLTANDFVFSASVQ